MIVVGSQSILGSYREEDLPTAATMSLEVNILPIADTDEETARLADQIEGVAGEWSLFEEQHGFRIDGVDLTTATLPAGWRDRLVTLSEPQYGPAVGSPQFSGFCLNMEDLCVAKLCAFREKDRNFVAALLDARHRWRRACRHPPAHRAGRLPGIKRALEWLSAWA